MRGTSIIIVAVACIAGLCAQRAQACTPNEDPVAIITGGASRTVQAGIQVTFDGSESYDPDGPALVEYTWTFDGVSPNNYYQEVSGRDAIVTLAFPSTATDGTQYDVTLKVRDTQSWMENNTWRSTNAVTMRVTISSNTSATWYVKTEADGGDDNNNGQSWDTAFRSLQKAIDMALPGTQVWVAVGVYKPTPVSGAPRLATFTGGQGVSIYGGFAVGQTATEQRDLKNNITTLSGDLNDDDPCKDDNCYRVVSCDGAARIDGFTITGGNGNDDVTGHDNGGAFSGTTTFANCTFRGNRAKYGGAVSTVGSPTFEKCLFEDNRATATDGGAIWASGSGCAIVATNCLFRLNTATLGKGGAISVSNHVDSTITNCVFDRNAAIRAGGMNVRDYCETTLTNCTFSQNTSSLPTPTGFDGPGFRIIGGTLCPTSITNCIFWGNNCTVHGDNSISDQVESDPCNIQVLSHNCIEHWDGSFSDPCGLLRYNGNIGDNLQAHAPLFVNAAQGDLHIASNSPCKDMGNSAASGIGTTDIDGQPRVSDGIVDIGADEYCNVLYVDQSATGLNNGGSWSNAFADLQLALEVAENSPSSQRIAEIRIGAGTYVPTKRDNPSDSRSATFNMVDGVRIVGGFVDGVRDIAGNHTILSGDVLGDDAEFGTSNRGDDVFTVVSTLFLSNSTLDGVAIAKGNHGVYCNMYGLNLVNCRIYDNRTSEYGAGVYVNEGRVDMYNCVLYKNAAVSGGGAVFLNDEGYARLVNCTVVDNTSSPGSGGGLLMGWDAMCNFGLTITNSILWGNIGYANGSDTLGSQITDDWASASVDFSCVGANGYSGSPYGGEANIAGNPAFYNLNTGDLHIASNSPCKDTGNSAAPNIVATDIDGHPRVFNGTIDIGADEYCNVLYVDQSATGLNNGGSWSNAFTDLQSALEVAMYSPVSQRIGEIRVAAGTYVPTRRTNLDDSRSATFNMVDGVWIKGGFPHGGGERDLKTNETILSGPAYPDICYHVVTVRAVSESKLDGVIIRGGSATGEADGDGGGVFCAGTSGSLKLTNCRITGNSAARGGGMSVTECDVEMVNCLLYGNNSGGNGGGINVAGEGYVSAVNCTITDNMALDSTYGLGGGIYVDTDSSFHASNCIIWGNLGTGNGSDKMRAQISYNSLASLSVDYSCVGASGYSSPAFITIDAIITGSHNIISDPCFVSVAVSDYHLRADSPCIDAGNNLCLPSEVTTDIEGLPRKSDCPIVYNGPGRTVDMGAHEADIWVDAGPNKYLILTDSGITGDSTLTGRLPGGTGASVPNLLTWSLVSGPVECAVTIGSPHTLNTSLDFVVPVVGRYVFNLEAQYGTEALSDQAVVVIWEPIQINQMPIVEAGTYGTVSYPSTRSVVLDGFADDDGLPFGMVTTLWSVERITGGGFASFDNPYELNTTARVTGPGTYILKLQAWDGDKIGEDTAVLTVDGTSEERNVCAGSSTVIPFSSSPLNMGTLATAPSVAPTRCTSEWEVVGGDVSGVRFSDPTAVSPTLTFAKGGEYIFRLNASDGPFRMSDQVGITVVQAEAGARKSATLPAAGASVTVAMNDAFVRGQDGQDGCEWSVTSGSVAAIANFNVVKNQEQPAFEFTAGGVYELTLTARNTSNGLVQHQDTVWVTVQATVFVGGIWTQNDGTNVAAVYRRTFPTDAGWTQITPDEGLGEQLSTDTDPFTDPVERGQVVRSLCEYNGELYAAVSFASCPPQVYKWTGRGQEWTLVSDWGAYGAPVDVWTLCVYNGQLYASGPSARGDLYRYSNSSGRHVWECIYEEVGGYGNCSLAVLGNSPGNLYLGDAGRGNIRRYNGQSLTCVFEDHDDGTNVNSFAEFENRFYAGVDDLVTVGYGRITVSQDGGSTWPATSTIVAGGNSVLALSEFDFVHDCSNPMTDQKRLVIGEVWGSLYISDGVSSNAGAPIWNASNNDDITALVVIGGQVLIGTGVHNWQGGGGVHSWNGDFLDQECVNANVTDVSEGLPYHLDNQDNHQPEFGVQCMVESSAVSAPADVTLSISAEIEVGGYYTSATPSTSVTPMDSTNDQIRYTISYANVGTAVYTGMSLVAQLPQCVDYVSANNNGLYDPASHLVTWAIGNMGPGCSSGSSPSVLVVRINKYSMPGDVVRFDYRLANDLYHPNAENDAVCIAYWSGNIAYVNGTNSSTCQTGTSWETAFASLDDALRFAASPDSGCSQIWVAAGTYRDLLTFELPAGVTLYGGFAGNESSLSERDLGAGNETVLWPAEYIVANGICCQPVVVTMAYDGSRDIGCTLDGVTVKGGSRGVICAQKSTIRNCRIIDNNSGIHVGQCYITITSNWICGNDTAGIEVEHNLTGTTIRNNTIADNSGYGIIRPWPTSNGGSEGATVNCIFWSNTYLSDVPITDAGDTYYYTGTVNPFAGSSHGDYHLANSATGCIDHGSAADVGTDETDIDGESRIMGATVDIGADEYPLVKVIAGPDKTVALPADADTVDVPMSVTFEIAPGVSITDSELTAQWETIPANALGVDFHGQDAFRHPTVTFSGAGTYRLKVSAKYGSTVMSCDTVTVTVRMRLAANPATLAWSSGAITTLTASGFGTAQVPAFVKWDSPTGATMDPSISTASPFYSIATFPGGPGRYQLRAAAYDSLNSLISERSVWIPVTQRQVAVDVAADSRIVVWPNNTVAFSTSVRGIDPSQLRFTPVCEDMVRNLVHFAPATDSRPQFSASFDSPGTYTIGVSVEDDCSYVGWGSTEIVVLQVDVCSNKVIAAPGPVTLSGAAIGGACQTEWEALSTGLAISGSGAEVTATMTEKGLYYARFTVKDDEGNVIAHRDIAIAVGASTSLTVAAVDTMMQIPAGGYAETTVNCTVSGITGYTVEWVKPVGAVYSFEYDQPTAQSTKVRFTSPGTYSVGVVIRDSMGNVAKCGYVNVSVVCGTTSVAITCVDNPPAIATYYDGVSVDLQTSIAPTSFPGSIEWVCDDGGSMVGLATIDSRKARVTFPSPGRYTIRCYAVVDGQRVAYGDITIVVNNPNASVDAKVKYGTANAVREYSGILAPGTSMTFSLVGQTFGVTPSGYEWHCKRVMSNGTSQTVVVQNSTSRDDATISLTQEGRYIAELVAIKDGIVVARNTATIVLYPSAPVVSIGIVDYTEISVNQPFHLSQAYVLDDNAGGVIPANIEWSCTSTSSWGFIYNPFSPSGQFDYSPPYSRQNPTVTLSTPGYYRLYLAYTDSDGLVGGSSVMVLVKNNVTIDIDSYGTAWTHVPLTFDTVSITPVIDGLTFNWSVTSPNGAFVDFPKGRDVQCPELVFTQAGTFTLRLDVFDGTASVPVGNKSVDFTVMTNPNYDDVPPTITLAKVNDVSFLGGATTFSNVNGVQTIEVEATDADLDDIYLKLDGQLLSRDYGLLAETSQLHPGSPGSQPKLTKVFLFDPHCVSSAPGAKVLTADARDRAGHESSVSATLNTTNIIYNYVVDDATAPTLVFSAELTSSLGWNFDVFYASDSIMTATPIPPASITGTGTTVSRAFDFTGISKGSYKARLTAGGDTAFVYFDLVPASGGVVVATLDETLKSTNTQGRRIRELPRITTGSYNLSGSVYHPDYPDIEVAAGIFDSSVSYRLTISNNDGLSRNITPGELDADGCAYGSIGDIGTYGSFGTLDFTSFENGIYTITLYATCAGSSETDEVQVVLEAPLKIGNVKFSQEDLVVPIGAYPLRVVRTYDSFRKDKSSDFGYGWDISFSNMDISVKNDGIYRDVTLTLPSGERVTFQSQFVDHSDWDSLDKRLTYKVPTGHGIKEFVTYDGAEPYDEILKNEIALGQYWLYDGDGYPALPNSVDTSLHDPAGWCLTMEDGTQYIIGRYFENVDVTGFIYGDGWLDLGDYSTTIYSYRACGKPYLKCIKLGPTSASDTRDKVEFTVEPDSLDAVPVFKKVEYCSGGTANPLKSIEILRDNDGRVLAVNAPSEYGEPVTGKPTVKYDYDIYGNLQHVRRLVDKSAANPYSTTQFIYNDGIHRESDHYVTDIMDEQGLCPIRYLYDENGRLTGTIDAKDNVIQLTHDQSDPVNGKYEEVRNRSGNRTRYFYNDRGGVVLEQHLAPAPADVVLSTTAYGYVDYTLNVTNAAETYTNAYPDNPCVVTDSLGNSTYYQYDTAGHTLVTIDPELNKTTMTYDDHGNVLTTAQYRARRDTGTGAIVVNNNKIVFDEVSTSRNYYTTTSLLYFSGVTTTGANGLIWHSASLTCYDEHGRVDHTVQLDPTAAYFSTCVTGGIAKPHDDLRNLTWPDCPTTSYAYEKNISHSPDQPSSVTDASGAVTSFHYNENGAQDATWYNWDDPATTVEDYRHVVTVSDLDCQGRTVRTRRITGDDFLTLVPPGYLDGTTGTSIVLDSTVYNSIGKVDYSIDQDKNLTKYEYDEVGNVVETRAYNIGTIDFDDAPAIATYIASSANILTVSQTLYDAEGRAIVSVGPYDPAVYSQEMSKWPVGTETVYDTLGRVERTRRWAAVAIQLENLVSNGALVGKKAPAAANAWDGTGAAPANIGWKSNNAIPQVGNELSYSRTEYDPAGRVKMSVSLDENGVEQPTSYEYDNAGKQTAVIDPLGHDISRETVGRWSVITNCTPKADESHRTLTHYNGQQRDSVTDARNNITSFGYDDAGRLVWTQYPEAPYVMSFGTDNTPTMGTSHTYTHVGYDGLGRKAWESEQTTVEPAELAAHPELNKKEFGYDASGRLTSVTLPAVDDPEDSSADPVHPIYRYFFDTHGNQIGILDPKGRLTVSAYDEQNRQIRQYMPFVPATAVNSAADVLALDLTGKSFQSSQYDVFGRIETSTDYESKFTVYTYDAFGRLEFKRHYANIGAYDSQHPSTNADPRIRYTYDNMGRRDKVYVNDVEAEGQSYDADGNLTAVTGSQGSVCVGYEYNAVTGARSRTYTPNTDIGYGYDELGRLRTVSASKINGTTLASAKTTTYEYDDVGSRLWTKLPNLAATYHAYDAANRLSSVHNFQQYETNPDAPTGGTLSRYDYRVYANGRRAYSVEPDETELRWTYDAAGRLTDESYYDSAHSGYAATYTYDLVGNRKTRDVQVTHTGSAGPVLTTAYNYYDGTDRLHTETYTQYQPSGMLWDGRTVYAAAAPAGKGVRYVYADGQPALGQFAAFCIGLPNSWSEPLFYAALILIPFILFWPAITRLAGRNPLGEKGFRALWRQGVCILLAYSMLLTGGVIESLASGASLYDNLQLSVWGADGKSVIYDYDANGSLTSKTTQQSGVTTEVVAYEYDRQNHLVQAVTTGYSGGQPAASSTASFTYNEGGVRTSKTVDNITTTYLIDSCNPTGYAQVLEETTGSLRTSYILGDDVLAQHTAADGFDYLLYDGHGSTRQLVDDSQNLRDSYSYDAYGVQTSGGSGTSLRYSGEQYDSHLKQYYLRARYYDQSNGRFTQTDPFGGNSEDPQSLHKYTYCAADPVNGVDPSGQMGIVQTVGAVSIGVMLALNLYRPAKTLLTSARSFYDSVQLGNLVRTLTNQGLIDVQEGNEILLEAADASIYFLQTALGAMADIGRELAEQYAYSLVFAGVTKAFTGVASASVGVADEALSIVLAGRPEGHHLVFKCAVKAFRGQRKFTLSHRLHVGAPDGLHYRIANSRFWKLQPTNGRSMESILSGMGKEKWLKELGKCYKWLEASWPEDYKGIHKCYEKAVKSIGGADGLKYGV